MQVVREVFPVTQDFVKLECVWKSDKFILIETKHDCENENQGEDSGGNVSVEASAINYDTIENFLGDDQVIPNTECGEEGGEYQGDTKASFKNSSPVTSSHALPRSAPNAEPHYARKKVAFVSIKNHAPASQSVRGVSSFNSKCQAK